MAERLFGIETEYALSVTDPRGVRVSQKQALDGLMRNARRLLPHLPDELAHGLFLQNGARLYVDAGGHPEITTPECAHPWDVVRYTRAGESIAARNLHLILRDNGSSYINLNIRPGEESKWSARYQFYTLKAPDR